MSLAIARAQSGVVPMRAPSGVTGCRRYLGTAGLRSERRRWRGRQQQSVGKVGKSFSLFGVSLTLWDWIDLLHALKDVESHHGISAVRGLRGFNPHFQGNQQHTGGPSRFNSLGRAVARSNRPLLQPSHRHVCILWHDSLRWSSEYKHVAQPLKRTVVRYPARPPTTVHRPGLPLDLRLKTRVCANNYLSHNTRSQQFEAVNERGIYQAATRSR
jgi:hypothetical protein